MDNSATYLNSEFIVVANRETPAAISKAGKVSHPRLNIEELQRQIRELGVEIKKGENAYRREHASINAYIHDKASVHKYLAEQYVLGVTDRITRIGISNFPNEALNKDKSIGLGIGIKRDGSLYTIHITRSSGNVALDEAAKKIVRMSAPFTPIPLRLVEELDADVFIISSNLKFVDQKTGMTSK